MHSSPKASWWIRFFSNPAVTALANTAGGVALSFALALAFAVSPSFTVLPSLPWGIVVGLVTSGVLIFVNRLAGRASLVKSASAQQQLDQELQVRENSQFILSSLASAFDSTGKKETTKIIGVAWEPIMALCEILFPVPVRAQVFVVDSRTDGSRYFKAVPNGLGTYRREASSQRTFEEHSDTWKAIQGGEIIYCQDTGTEPYGCYMSRGIISKTGQLYGFFAVDAKEPGSLDPVRDQESLGYLATLLLLVMVAGPSVTQSVPLSVPLWEGSLELMEHSYSQRGEMEDDR